jgi:hypothetical protein
VEEDEATRSYKTKGHCPHQVSAFRRLTMSMKAALVSAGMAKRPLWSRHKIAQLYELHWSRPGMSEMSRSQFTMHLLNNKVCTDSLVANCIFTTFAERSSSMAFPEFTEASVLWTGGKEDEKLGLQFSLWDKFGQGYLDESCLDGILYYGMTEDATQVVTDLLTLAREQGAPIDRQDFIYAARGKQMWQPVPGIPKWHLNTMTTRFSGAGTSISEASMERVLLENGGWDWARRGDQQGSDQTIAASLHSPQKKAEPITMALRIPNGLLIGSSCLQNYTATHIESGTIVRGGVRGNRASLVLPGEILTTKSVAQSPQDTAVPRPAPVFGAQQTMALGINSTQRCNRKRRSWLACFSASSVQEPGTGSNNSNSIQSLAIAAPEVSEWLGEGQSARERTERTERTERQSARGRTDSVSSDVSASATTSSQGPRLSREGEQLTDFTDSLQCPVCFENRVDAVVAPCSHWFCSECAAKLHESGCCAMCRGEARTILTIAFTEQISL